MKERKVVIGIKSLAESERTAFGKFLNSPYFNTRERLVLLYETILSFAPGFDHKNLNAQFVGARIFPNETSNAQKVREQMSFLYRLLKSFLTHQELQEREYQGELFLLAQLRKRKLERAFEAEKRALKKRIDQNPYQDLTYYWNKYQVANESFEMRGQQQLRVDDRHLQEKMDHLDAWYGMMKLRESAEMLNRQRILNTTFDLSGLKLVDSVLLKSTHAHAHSPLIKLYREVIRMLETGTDKHFRSFVELLAGESSRLPAEEARGLYKHAQNYCIRQINAGVPEFEQEIFQLYQKQLHCGLIPGGGIMAHTDYKNIVTVALRLSAYDWAIEFLNQYKELVPAEYRENVYNFNMAACWHAQGELPRAIKLLRTVHFSDTFYDISARRLLLQCYYQQGDWEAAYYLVEAFRLFLTRNKALSVTRRTNHLNFLRYFIRLLKLREQADWLKPEVLNKRSQKLMDRLERAQQTAHLNWLREEAEVLGTRSLFT